MIVLGKQKQSYRQRFGGGAVDAAQHSNNTNIDAENAENQIEHLFILQNRFGDTSFVSKISNQTGSSQQRTAVGFLAGTYQVESVS